MNGVAGVEGQAVADDRPDDADDRHQDEALHHRGQHVLAAHQAAVEQRQSRPGHHQHQRRAGEHPGGVAGVDVLDVLEFHRAQRQPKQNRRQDKNSRRKHKNASQVITSLSWQAQSNDGASEPNSDFRLDLAMTTPAYRAGGRAVPVFRAGALSVLVPRGRIGAGSQWQRKEDLILRCCRTPSREPCGAGPVVDRGRVVPDRGCIGWHRSATRTACYWCSTGRLSARWPSSWRSSHADTHGYGSCRVIGSSRRS